MNTSPTPAPSQTLLTEKLRRAEGEVQRYDETIHKLTGDEGDDHGSEVIERYVADLRTQLRELGEQLALAKKDIAERIATFHADRPNGEWIDRWGACRVCGGEIPHGHTENCDHYKQEKEIMALRTRLAALQQTVGEADPEREFARSCLQSSKEAVADGSMSEEDEATMECAARLGYGNVRKVVFDPKLHGDVGDAEPGAEIWYWGAPTVNRLARQPDQKTTLSPSV